MTTGIQFNDAQAVFVMCAELCSIDYDPSDQSPKSEEYVANLFRWNECCV